MAKAPAGEGAVDRRTQEANITEDVGVGEAGDEEEPEERLLQITITPHKIVHNLAKMPRLTAKILKLHRHNQHQQPRTRIRRFVGSVRIRSTIFAWRPAIIALVIFAPYD